MSSPVHYFETGITFYNFIENWIHVTWCDMTKNNVKLEDIRFGRSCGAI